MKVSSALDRLQGLSHTIYRDRVGLGWANCHLKDAKEKGKHAAESPQPCGGALTEVGGVDSVHTIKSLRHQVLTLPVETVTLSYPLQEDC